MGLPFSFSVAVFPVERSTFTHTQQTVVRKNFSLEFRSSGNTPREGLIVNRYPLTVGKGGENGHVGECRLFLGGW